MYLLNAQTRRRKDRRLEQEAEGESVNTNRFTTAEKGGEDISDQDSDAPRTSKRQSIKRKAVSRVIYSDDEEDANESQQEKEVVWYMHLISLH